MTAFPQLGYGFKTNVKTIKATEPTDEYLSIWRHLSTDEKVDLIVKENPECMNRSELYRYALWEKYNKNPTQLIEIYLNINNV